MMPISVGELARRCGATIVGLNPETLLYGFALDSRDAGAGALFLAIDGAKVDGHAYVEEALRNGAVTALVEREIDAPHILVSNLVEALAQLAHTYRVGFRGPVVGVTGSAGKTTTKELLSSALAPMGQVGKTEGNRNTEFTAPLMWVELDGDEAAVVVEMSMRGFGQIEHLAKFSEPTVGVVTNIGANHSAMVGGRDGVARAKAELFRSLPPDGLAVYWSEDAYAEFLRKQAPCPVATFGWGDGSDARIAEFDPKGWFGSRVRIFVDGAEVEVDVPSAGRHSALNAAAALLVASRCGVDLNASAQCIASAKIPGMRMQAVEWSGATIVLDNYNAAPDSFVAALQTMAEIPCIGRRIVVAGEMRELGEDSAEGHRQVGEAIASAHPDLVVFFGAAMNGAREAAAQLGFPRERMQMVEALEEIMPAIGSLSKGDTVLVKGSRALELERAFPAISPKEEADSR